MFFDQQEAGGEAISEFLAPWNALGCGEALIDEIEDGKQEQWLVLFLLRGAVAVARGRVHPKGVETFYGFV